MSLKVGDTVILNGSNMFAYEILEISLANTMGIPDNFIRVTLKCVYKQAGLAYNTVGMVYPNNIFNPNALSLFERPKSIGRNKPHRLTKIFA